MFDGYIIDECDYCIMKKGVKIFKDRNRVIGFWNLLEKRTILLTATTCHALEDLLNHVYKVKLTDFIRLESAAED